MRQLWAGLALVALIPACGSSASPLELLESAGGGSVEYVADRTLGSTSTGDAISLGTSGSTIGAFRFGDDLVVVSLEAIERVGADGVEALADFESFQVFFEVAQSPQHASSPQADRMPSRARTCTCTTES